MENNFLSIQQFCARIVTLTEEQVKAIVHYHKAVTTNQPTNLFGFIPENDKHIVVRTIQQYATYLQEWADEEEDKLEFFGESKSDI